MQVIISSVDCWFEWQLKPFMNFAHVLIPFFLDSISSHSLYSLKRIIIIMYEYLSPVIY